jgi:enoyl-CoA hydratase/carnithine racemase
MSPVAVERGGGLAEVVLDDPPLNLFDAAMITSLEKAVAGLAADPPRAVLIRARGEVVSGGVNVSEFHGLSAAGGRELWTRLMDGIIDPIESLPCPVVFSSHGLTLTAAFELALGCDLILASESARFGLVEVVVGLTPSMGGPQRLAERAGSGRARQLVMTGDLFDAATLERWNVVNAVYRDEELEERSRRLAERLAKGPTLAHAMTKRIVRAWADEGMEAADRITREEAADLLESEDLQRAVETFLSEGPGNATFEGR